MSTDNKSPKRVRFTRIIPQIRLYKKGTLLKNKVDLYYTIAEDIVESDDDAQSPLHTTANVSIPQPKNFICRDSTLFFVEAAQFRANNGNVYIRAHLIVSDKSVWVNLVEVPNRVWAFKIRKEQKELIKAEMNKKFTVLKDAAEYLR